MEKNETKFSKYFNLPNPGLRAYFDHVEKGQPDEYRTPFYKGKSNEEILKGWDDTLLAISEKWPSLYQYEIDLRSKVGPMSIMKPLSERMGDIDSYYDSILLESKPISDDAIRSVISEWGRNGGGLRIRGVDRTVGIMKKSTNSGAPYFSKRRTVTDKTVPYSISHSTGEQILPSGSWQYAAVLGWRGQEGGPLPSDVKQRVVWMFPYAINIEELRVYQPLIEMCQRFNLVPAWVSMEQVDKAVTSLFDTKRPDDLVICTDFSKFDQHFNSALQQASSQILGSLFKGDETISSWLENIYPIKFDIPLAYDWNAVRHGKHGMASGSGGTNADETMAHRALQYEAAMLSNSKLNPYSQCLGDDGIISYPGCTVDKVVQAYSSHGLDMNPDKQYASKQDCVYLRRWHHRDYRVDGVCVGVYSTYRALGRLANQERYFDPEVWGPKMIALRQLSILENVKYHPLREEFVSYCMKGDKFRLGLDIPGFMDNIEKIAQESIEHIPDFLGYTKSLQLEGKKSTGIQNWWIVNYLKSLA